MERINYLKLLGIGASLSSFNLMSLASQEKNNNINKIKAQKLNVGDKIAIIAPGTAVSSPDEIQKAKDVADYFGLEAVFGKNVLTGSGYKTRSVKERVDDLHWAFTEKSIKGIFCIRGGYGSASLLESIDFDLIKQNPKIFCGYSDITALHLAIHKMTGIVTFHGPVMLSTFDDITIKAFKDIFFDNNLVEYKNPESNRLRNYNPVSVIKDGEASGKLIGGNLSLICSLMGTKFEIDTTDKILFIEDVGEEPYKLHRMLTQLNVSKKFDNIRGLIIGKCNDCESKSNNTWDMSEMEVYYNILSTYKFPIMYGYLIGHTNSQFILPYGIEITINTKDKSLLFKEKALVI